MVDVPRGNRDAELLVVGGEDRGAVLRPDVVALAHPLGRVVVLPEDLEELLVRALRRVVGDEDGLGVAGSAAADLAVVRVRRLATDIADGGADHAGRLPEVLLGAPEAAHREDRRSGAVGPGRGEGRTVDV